MLNEQKESSSPSNTSKTQEPQSALLNQMGASNDYLDKINHEIELLVEKLKPIRNQEVPIDMKNEDRGAFPAELSEYVAKINDRLKDVSCKLNFLRDEIDL